MTRAIALYFVQLGIAIAALAAADWLEGRPLAMPSVERITFCLATMALVYGNKRDSRAQSERAP